MSDLKQLSDRAGMNQEGGEELVALHRTMVRIRCLELGLRELFQEMRRKSAQESGSRLSAFEYGNPEAGPELQGNLELAIGQETVAGAVTLLRDTDYLGATHRAHHFAVSKGVPLQPMLAELFGRRTGLCGGRAGDFNLHDTNVNFENSPVIGQLIPVAAGHALAAQLDGRDEVAMISLGDGAINQGTFHEAANLAGLWDLPVIFLLENNGYALSVDIARSSPIPDRLYTRADSYGIPGVLVEGNDPLALRKAAAEAIARARTGGGATLIELRTDRQAGGFEGDRQLYRPEGEVEKLEARDPLRKLESELVEAGLMDQAAAEVAWADARAEVVEAIEFARSSPWPEPSDARRSVFAEKTPISPPDEPTANGEILARTFGDAIGAAVKIEMDLDEKVVVFAEDVARMGGIFGHLRGLEDRFGTSRVRDTPISEAGFIGAAAGAAAEGIRPVTELMTIDFFGVAMDQIYNYLAKVRYVSGGSRSVPMVILASAGNPLRQGVTHSQTLHGTFAHLPGLKVVMPATAEDAGGLLRTAIKDDDPVLYLFHRGLIADSPGKWNGGGEGITSIDPVPFGSAAVRRQGSDLTIVAASYMVSQAMHAAQSLERQGVAAEVIDLRTLVPLDRDTILESVGRTRRLLVLDEDYGSFGTSGEVIAQVAESGLGSDVVLRRVARAQTPIPYSRVLEDEVMPGEREIVTSALEMCGV